MTPTAGQTQLSTNGASSPAYDNTNRTFTTPNYFYSPNGTGGVNYYRIYDSGGYANTPIAITREQYGSATGADPGAIETQAKSAYSTSQAAPTNTVQSPGSVGGQTTSPDYSQQIGQYQNQLNTLLPTQLNAGNQSIDRSYQTAIQQLLGQKNLGQQNYDTTKQQSATNYVGAKNTIGAQAGSTLNGLLRLLGSRGAGGSSAYNIAAPQAVARNASIQRNDAGTTFGQNQQALDQNWGQYLQGYNDQVGNLGVQRDQNKQSLSNQIDSSRATLLQQIAGLQSSPSNAQPYLDQANNTLARVAGYVAPSFNYTSTPYQAPAAASYTTAPGQTISAGGSTTGNDYFSPFLQTLLGKKQPQQSFV